MFASSICGSGIKQGHIYFTIASWGYSYKDAGSKNLNMNPCGYKLTEEINLFSISKSG